MCAQFCHAPLVPRESANADIIVVTVNDRPVSIAQQRPKPCSLAKFSPGDIARPWFAADEFGHARIGPHRGIGLPVVDPGRAQHQAFGCKGRNKHVAIAHSDGNQCQATDVFATKGAKAATFD